MHKTAAAYFIGNKKGSKPAGFGPFLLHFYIKKQHHCSIIIHHKINTAVFVKPVAVGVISREIGNGLLVDPGLHIVI